MSDSLIKITVGELFLNQARNYGLRRFIYRPDGRSVTYQQAVIEVATRVEQMIALGIKRGDKILCYSDIPDPTIYFFLAAQFLGAIPLPVSPLFSPDYAAQLAARIKSDYVFCDPAFDTNFNLLKTRYATAIQTEDLQNKYQYSYEFLQRIHTGISSEDVIMLQSTAGSTGEPKLVVRRHSSLTHYATHLRPEIANNYSIDLNAPPKYLMLLSFSHSFAYHQMTTALSLGAELAVPWSVDTKVSLDEIHLLNPTILSLPPRVLRSLAQQEKNSISPSKTEKLFPSGSQYVIIGGGEGDGTILRRVMTEGLTPIQIYSTSESSMIAITKNKTWLDKSAGQPLDNVKIKIDTDGELLVKTPGLMIGYLNDPDSTTATFDSEGFFKTGDLGRLTDLGHLQILGRKKDVFNIPEGSNIYPGRIEDLIEASMPGCQVILAGDNRPYLGALICLSTEAAEKIDSPDGFLIPENHVTHYKQIGKILETINLGLEQPEKIIRFQLFAKCFPKSCYHQVQGVKVRRNRIETAKLFSARIAELYSSPSQLDGSIVPNTDLRLLNEA